MLRLIGTLLVWGGVVVGSAAVLTIYQPKLTASNQSLEGHTLDRKVTIYVTTEESPDVPQQVVFERTTELKPEMLDQLREAGLDRIVVGEFAWRAWGEWWIFALGTSMMIGGAVCMRLGARREIAAMTSIEDDHEASPISTIAAIRAILERLAGELPTLPDDEMRCETVVTRLDQVQQSLVPAFAGARNALIGKYGLAGYAGSMDRFASLERQINRAWSSAADRIYSESEGCIALALEILPEVEQRLGIPPISTTRHSTMAAAEHT